MYGDNMTLSLLEEKLNEIGDNTASTVISKIKPLVDYDPFHKIQAFHGKILFLRMVKCMLYS